MKNINQGTVHQADLREGHFNNCEHTFMELEAGKDQTISVKLPNGKFVTFAFIHGQGTDTECVDIHSTVGKEFKYKPTDEDSDIHFVQHAIGFSRRGDTFDTRDAGKPTGLITLLLGKTIRTDRNFPSNAKE
jgi:hypothetical protein